MKQIPILFSTPMVQAIIEGRKTQTRRIVKPQPTGVLIGVCTGSTDGHDIGGFGFAEGEKILGISRPKYRIGDLLWVRETFINDPFGGTGYIYKADFAIQDQKISGWKPSIHMPKEAARIWLEVVNVKIERLNDITLHDAINEGLHENIGDPQCDSFKNTITWSNGFSNYSTPFIAFCNLWERINGQGSWTENPWLWVIEFKPTANPNLKL